MTIINISRQPYSSGNEIAQEIAEKLGYKLIDKQLINSKIQDFHCNFSDELSDLADEKEPGFFKHFFKDPEVYNYLLQSILFEEASCDNVVIKGRGGQYIMPQPFVLNIRIVAPFEKRCAALESEKGLKKNVAQRVLEKKDQERENFISYLFNEDSSKTDAYDLVFNHHKLETTDIVSTIYDYAKRTEAAVPVTEKDKDLFRCLALEKRVQASIRKEIPDVVHLKVECETLGKVKLSGFAPDEIESSKIFQLANKCYGVTSVENDMDTIRMHKT